MSIDFSFPTYDPEVAAEVRQMHSGRLDGLPGFLGITVPEIGPGRAVCEIHITEQLLNPFGAAHGGIISGLVDHCLGVVCLPVIPRGTWPATMEYKLNLLSAGRLGVMSAVGEIIALRASSAVVRVDVSNGGRLIGAAQGTVALMAPRQPSTQLGQDVSAD